MNATEFPCLLTASIVITLVCCCDNNENKYNCFGRETKHGHSVSFNPQIFTLMAMLCWGHFQNVHFTGFLFYRYLTFWQFLFTLLPLRDILGCYCKSIQAMASCHDLEQRAARRGYAEFYIISNVSVFNLVKDDLGICKRVCLRFPCTQMSSILIWGYAKGANCNLGVRK